MDFLHLLSIKLTTRLFFHKRNWCIPIDALYVHVSAAFDEWRYYALILAAVSLATKSRRRRKGDERAAVQQACLSSLLYEQLPLQPINFNSADRFHYSE